jgi:hypothetical protein
MLTPSLSITIDLVQLITDRINDPAKTVGVLLMSIQSSDRLSRGREAFALRRYDVVIEILNDFSVLDSSMALTLLAEAMLRVQGPRDNEKILRLQIMAANLGSVLCCLRVAEEFYLFSDKLKQAEEYFLKAAQLGSNLAHRRLGDNYLNTGDNHSRGQRYLRAAEHGNPRAMFEYGRMLELGLVEPNYTRYPSNPVKGWFEKDKSRRQEAQGWYIEAALAGNIEVVGHMMETPLLGLSKPIMRDVKSSRSLIEAGVRDANILALSVKGYSLLHSRNLTGTVCTETMLSDAFALLLRAAQKGNYYAMGEIANLYYEGRGVDRSFERAFAWSLYAMQCESKYAPPIEERGLLLPDVEEKIPLELCMSIKRDPVSFCK